MTDTGNQSVARNGYLYVFSKLWSAVDTWNWFWQIAFFLWIDCKFMIKS
jgi:hypothetical protein